MQVKKFTNFSSDNLVSDVNKWLDKNPGIKVISTDMAFNITFYYFIMYEGHAVYE